MTRLPRSFQILASALLSTFGGSCKNAPGPEHLGVSLTGISVGTHESILKNNPRCRLVAPQGTTLSLEAIDWNTRRAIVAIRDVGRIRETWSWDLSTGSLDSAPERDLVRVSLGSDATIRVERLPDKSCVLQSPRGIRAISCDAEVAQLVIGEVIAVSGRIEVMPADIASPAIFVGSGGDIVGDASGTTLAYLTSGGLLAVWEDGESRTLGELSVHPLVYPRLLWNEDGSLSATAEWKPPFTLKTTCWTFPCPEVLTIQTKASARSSLARGSRWYHILLATKPIACPTFNPK